MFPRNGGVFYRDETLAAGEQAIRGWVVSRPGEDVHVSLNGQPLPGTEGALLLPVEPGRYRLEAVGPAGTDSVVYSVR